MSSAHSKNASSNGSDPTPLPPVQVLLADDDMDDRYFFEKVLSKLPTSNQLTTVVDGEKLMNYLIANYENLPSILFLDLNMPRKNGSECLLEIKHNEKLKHLPVIVYSTSMPGLAADLLYDNGAHHYVRKTNVRELQNVLHYILASLADHTFARPTRENFVLTFSESIAN